VNNIIYNKKNKLSKNNFEGSETSLNKKITNDHIEKQTFFKLRNNVKPIWDT